MDQDAPAVRGRLDAIGFEHIAPVVDGRGQLIARHGMSAFAEYFSPFSAAERHLNRAWSALTDGHAPAARDALDRVSVELKTAQEAWEQCEAARPSD